MLKDLISLYYTNYLKKNSLEWTKIIEKAIQNYLIRKHRTYGMTQLDCEMEENERGTRKCYIKNT